MTLQRFYLVRFSVPLLGFYPDFLILGFLYGEICVEREREREREREKRERKRYTSWVNTIKSRMQENITAF